MNTFLRILTAFFLFLNLLLCAQVSFAQDKYNLVLFYANWNVYSSQAINTLESVSQNNEKISFEKINIDDKKAFLRMKQLGVMPTNTLPYYFLMDKNKKILYGSSYKHETVKTISDILNKKIQE